GQPVDPELSPATGHDLLGHDVRTTWTDGHVELFGGIEALGLRRVVARELRLGNPLELERHLIGSLTESLVGSHGKHEQGGHDPQEPSLHHQRSLLWNCHGMARRSTNATAN